MESDRKVVLGGVLALALSLLVPIAAASTLTEGYPFWLGAIEVMLALAMGAVARVIEVRARGRDWAADAPVAAVLYRVYAAVPLALLVLYFMLGSTARWDILLPGLAWRGAVLLYATLGACVLLDEQSLVVDEPEEDEAEEEIEPAAPRPAAGRRERTGTGRGSRPDLRTRRRGKKGQADRPSSASL
jgi:hypothetical protein